MVFVFTVVSINEVAANTHNAQQVLSELMDEIGEEITEEELENGQTFVEVTIEALDMTLIIVKVNPLHVVAD